jgi:hypothetical protein
MSMAALSLEQAPPISVPFRFFLSAPLFLLLAATAWLLAGSDALASRWTPALLGITHLLTLGCMAMIMFGAMLQLLPVLAGAPVPNPRLVAWLIHLPLLVGTLLLSYGLYFSAALPLKFAMALLAFALLTFLLAAIVSLARAPARNDSTRAMLLALAALALTLGLGLALAAGVAGMAAVPLVLLTALHAGWGLPGWTALLVMGVAYQVVPMFQLTPAYPRLATRWLAASMFVLLLLWSAHPVLPEDAASLLERLAGMGLAVCLAVFAIITLRLQFKRKRRVADVTRQFWQLGMGSLLACIALWLGAQASTAIADSAAFPLALGMLFILGFALSVIIGMLYKIVPFLIWFHLQSILPARQVPHMKEIIADSDARRHLRAHWLCLPLFLLSSLWPTPWMYAAGAALMLDGILLLLNLLRAWRRYLRGARPVAANSAVGNQ